VSTTQQPKRVLLIGGTSEIGLAIIHRLAEDGPVRPFLLGRDRARLDAALEQLGRARSQGGAIEQLDATDHARHRQVVAEVFEAAGGFDVVVLAVGVLGGQAGLDTAPEEALEVMEVDFAGAGSLLLESLRQLRAQQDGAGGTLVVLSTVAAERPRASNAIYGAAKAGLDSLAQGLADATAGTGVRVLVVRPGFVTTKMTDGLKPPPMSTTPEAVADATVRALAGGAHTVWVPGRLRFVFAVLRHLPRAVWRKLPL
jgi:decaprenylphospho-beta-D-erythro-pentofuranosid-2-ulose 2-reductase